ncbi:MAG: radical SAM protein [Spirochaetales bacterium]|nr:radical SAM protein [Leptospiraceae bacterium]MCP5483568.1 radical SAM protein [Spirochaetales bacterium]MCP5486422.1 radical SAM protein [Spirochaetales bacterium]
MKETRNLPVTVPTTLQELEELVARYPNLPAEAIVKQDLLRLGMAFDAASLGGASFKEKDYFIFTFDHVPLGEQDEQIRFRIPEEIRLRGGHFELAPTVVSVRVNPGSPYRVKATERGPAVFLGDVELGEVEFPPVPAFYAHRTSAGKSPGEIAPVIEWGYLIYLTVFRNCQYFGKEEECAFCDINHNYRQQKAQGRPYTGVKSLEEILEVLAWIDQEDTTAQVYTITGGSVVKDLRGKKETDFYFDYARGIEEKFPGRWMGKIVTQAWEPDELVRFRDAGIRIYHPNYEVWDERLFDLLCPGKARFVGRETWMRRIVQAAEIFGPSCVIPNFVGGVELSKPYGFSTIDEAIRSTREGLDFFMSHGVVPRFTTWCPEPFTTLTTIAPQEHPPLEYFCELLSVWKATFEKYSLPVPPGYGEPGPGRAVFSVSAFMDVVGYEGRASQRD